MSCRVIFRSSALTDIDGAYHWYEQQQQPRLGDSFMAALGKAEALLGDNPIMFGRIHGEVRRAVLHQARNPKLWHTRK